MNLRVLPLATLGLLLGGCVTKKGHDSWAISVGVSNKIHSDTLNPGAIPYTKARLVMNGHPFQVDVKSATKGEIITHSFESHGVAIETETYRQAPGLFELVAYGDEVFKRPIPLLKFPFSVGDSWTWQGSFGADLNPIPATAEITTADEPLALEGFPQSDSVRVEVNLQYGSPTKPSERKLLFWFVEGKGMVKRQIHFGSTRQP
ncbi:MAG: hypothetical protein JNJ45_09435 [Chthonomonas sp.]|nr:hypothetical protein [Chthonomonas sp.]